MLKPKIRVYPPRYRLIKNQKTGKKYTYYYPRRGETLIFKRIIDEILDGDASVDAKVDTLNEREKNYARAIKCDPRRVYPYWAKCSMCGKNIVLVEKSSQNGKKCNSCSRKRKLSALVDEF